MSAQELTNNLISKIESDKYQFILINYANADMVGHTGNLQAGIKAIKTLDNCLSKVVPIALQFNWKILITADHGNAEEMINPKTGEPSTEHSGNPVPFIFVSKDFQNKPIKLQKGILGDIAPTILSLFKIQKPPEMTGNNLLSEIIIE